MKEIRKRSRMSETNSPIIAPLINLLKYKVSNPFSNQLLLGTAPDLPSLHEHTKTFLKQLRLIKGRLTPLVTPITQQEYTEEVNRLREATSLGNSYTTPAMVKTEALDPELRGIRRLRFNLPWYTGYSPKRFRQGLDLLIHKYPEDYIPHRLRPLLLLGIKTNIHNK